ncbi:hypothetical protein CWI38_1129p0030, partial [Hamiltosporidium tvaerminnensis]
MEKLLEVFIKEIKESHDVDIVVEWCNKYVKEYYTKESFHYDLINLVKTKNLNEKDKMEILNVCINLFHFGYDITNKVCHNKYTNSDARSINVVSSMVCWGIIGKILMKYFDDEFYIKATEIFDDASFYLCIPNKRNDEMNYFQSKARLHFYTKVYLPLRLRDLIIGTNVTNNYLENEPAFVCKYLVDILKENNIKEENNFNDLISYFGKLRFEEMNSIFKGVSLENLKEDDHLATRCEKMLGYDYTRRHNEVVRCLHLLLLNRYKFKSSKRIRSHSVQEILDNEYAEIRVDTRIKTDVKIRNNRPDIFILDKKKNKITLIEVGITSQDSLQIVETENLRKYDLLANELGLIYRCSVEIIPYVMTWDGIVTKYHKSHLKRLEIPMNVEAYIQSIV